MRSRFFIGSFAFAFVFAACTGPSFETEQEDIFNRQENFLYNFDDIDESASGWSKVPDFLNKIDMNDLAALKLFGGTKDFTSTECRLMYKRHNEASNDDLSDESCGYNTNDDGTFQDYQPNGPIFLALKQFDENFLFFMAEEEGLDGRFLFGYTYDLRTGETRSMNQWPDNFYAVPYYFRGSVCYIESYSIPIAEWEIATNTWTTFDYADGEGNESNDIKIVYSADIDSGEPYDLLDASIIRVSTNETLVPSIRKVLPELDAAFNFTLTMIPRLSKPGTIVFRKVLMNTDASSYDYYSFDVKSKTFRLLSDTEKYGELYDGFCHTKVN